MKIAPLSDRGNHAGDVAVRPAEVLDIQKLSAVPAPKYPNAVPTCDVLVVGGGLGGVAAAEALASQRMTVILTEPTAWLGGQLTSEGVACPDENSYIEKNPGCGTRTYRLLREELREQYAKMPGIKSGRSLNPGMCWVSRLSGEPAVWESVIRTRLDALRGPAGIRDILLRNQLIEVRQFPQTGQYHYADFVNLDTGRVTRVAARFLLDASETGDALASAGCPWTVGAEPKSAQNEPDAPPVAHPDWIQSLTYCFAVRWQAKGPYHVIEKPAAYEQLKSLGEYTLGYDYSDSRGRVYYKMLQRVPGAGGPFWTYRRLVAASSFTNNLRYTEDLALINWRGNDFHLANPIGKPIPEQISILKKAKEFSLGFLYWLQTECPRDDGGQGYPEIQLAPDAMGTDDGLSMQPYVRESRRLLADFTLNENHLKPDPARPNQKYADEFADSVGIALYAMDVHPVQGEPPFLSRALPYQIPLGSFLGRSGPRNVLPAAKDFGGTRLALSSARMHPTEWLIGEVAGHLAAFCLRRNIEPKSVRSDPALLAAFQQELEDSGDPLRWSDIIR